MSEIPRRLVLGATDPQVRIASHAAVVVRLLNDVRKLKVQLRPHNCVDVAELGRALDITAFPDSARTAVHGTPAVFWTAPGEWLLTGEHVDIAQCMRRLEGVLGDTTHALTDLSHGVVALELGGQRCGELLAAACSIDFHSPEAGAGRYVMTRMQRLPVLIHRPGQATLYHIYVERSVTRFVHDWLRWLADRETPA